MIGVFRGASVFSTAALQALQEWANTNLIASIPPPSVDDYTTAYYFDSVGGDDANSGLNENNPKQTVGALKTRLESMTDGDIVLLKAGSYWQENDVGSLIDGAGSLTGEGIAITSYGVGERPIYSTEHVQIFDAADITGPNPVLGVDMWTINTSAHFYPPLRRLWVDDIEYMGQSTLAYTWIPDSDTGVDGIHTHWSVSDRNAFRTAFDPSGREFKWHAEEYCLKFINSKNVIIHGIELRGGRWQPGNQDAGALVIGDYCEEFDIRLCEFGKSCDGINVRPKTDSANVNNITIRNNSFDTQYDVDHLYNATLKYGHLYYGLSYLEDGIPTGSQSSPRGPVNAITCERFTFNTIIRDNYFRNWCHATVRMYDTGTGSVVTYPNSRTSGKFIHNNLGGLIPYGNRIDATASGSNWEVAYNYQDGFSSNQLCGHSMWYHHNIILNGYHSYFKNLNDGEALNIDSYYGDTTEYHVIENNIFKDCDGAGTGLLNTSRNCIIRNNIYMNNDQSVAFRTDSSLRGGQGNMNFVSTGRDALNNNVISNNLIFDDRTPITMTHSIQNGGTYYEMTPTEYNDFITSWFTAENNVGGDPLFVDEVDFRIATSSPASGTGIIPTATIDYDGLTISSPYNIGIYNTEV